jgi:hypothetical protein
LGFVSALWAEVDDSPFSSALAAGIVTGVLKRECDNCVLRKCVVGCLEVVDLEIAARRVAFSDLKWLLSQP